MNLEDIGSIGELIGAIAAVAMFGYLAIQVRRNSLQLAESARLARLGFTDLMLEAFSRYGELLTLPNNADLNERIRMFGLANELLGEGGLAYCKRHFMTAVPLTSLPEDSPEHALFAHLGEKYGYSEEKPAHTSSRIVNALRVFDARLTAQRAHGTAMGAPGLHLSNAPAASHRILTCGSAGHGTRKGERRSISA